MPSSSPPEASLPGDVDDLAEPDAEEGDDAAARAAEASAAFTLRMRARGVRDRNVLRAIELVPRALFAPERLAAFVRRDLAVPIGCGQTLHEPWLVAQMIEALGVEPYHHVLEIGSGTGYATAILAHLARQVTGYERFRSLARGAQARLEAGGAGNAAIVCGDGLAAARDGTRYDRIIAHGLVAVPATLLAGLAADGVLVCARHDTGVSGAQHVVRIERAGEGDGIWREERLHPCRLEALMSGIAAVL